MRRPGLATAVAVLFALSALSDVYNVAEWAGGRGGGPGPLALVHVPAGLLAAGVAVGAWRRARWAAPLAAIWGVLGSTAALTLGPRVVLPPEVPPGARAVVPLALGLAAVVILTLGLGTAAYLRRLAGAHPAA